MKSEYEVEKSRSLGRKLLHAGLFMGVVAAVVFIARMITGREHTAR